MGDQLKKEKIFKHAFTVGQLLDWIEKNNIPKDAPIVYQRIHDIYFEQYNWSTLRKKGDSFHKMRSHNIDVDSGKYLDEENYPLIKPEHLRKFSEDEMIAVMDEYVPVSSPVFYDNECLYLDAHY